MAINNTLKDIREERNLVQADLAKAVGSCSDTIGRIERGERNASLEIAIRLAHYFCFRNAETEKPSFSV